MAMFWKDPLPTDPTPIRGSRWSPAPKERMEALIPPGWQWAGNWKCEDWDHASAFPSFLKRSREPLYEWKLGKDCRRRRWYRSRVLAPPGPAAGTMGGSGVGEASAISGAPPTPPPPGFRWLHTHKAPPEGSPSPLLTSSSSSSSSSKTTTNTLSSGYPLGVASSLLPSSSSSYHHQSQSPAAIAFPFTPNSSILRMRLGAGPWSEGIACNPRGTPALTNPAVSLRLEGDTTDSTTVGGCSWCPGVVPGYDITVVVEMCPPPLTHTARVCVFPTHTLVNSTGGGLWWRQAGALSGGGGGGGGGGPIAHPPVYLFPYSSTPIYFPQASSPPLLQLSPISTRGAWSPPIPLTLPRKAQSSLSFPLCIPVKLSATAGGGGGGYFQETHAGVAPLGLVTVACRLRKGVGGGATSTLIISQETHPAEPIRPPLHFSSGSQSLLRAELAVDDMARRFGAGLGSGRGRTPPPPPPQPVGRDPPQQFQLFTPSPPVPQLLTRPLLSLSNHSSFTLVLSHFSPRPRDALGAELTGGVGSSLRGDQPLGSAFATGLTFSSPGEVTIVGLPDCLPLWEEKEGGRDLDVRALDISKSGQFRVGASVRVSTSKLESKYCLGWSPQAAAAGGGGVLLSVRLVAGCTQLIAVNDDLVGGGATGGGAGGGGGGEQWASKQAELLADAIMYGEVGKDAVGAAIDRIERGHSGWIYHPDRLLLSRNTGVGVEERVVAAFQCVCVNQPSGTAPPPPPSPAPVTHTPKPLRSRLWTTSFIFVSGRFSNRATKLLLCTIHSSFIFYPHMLLRPTLTPHPTQPPPPPPPPPPP